METKVTYEMNPHIPEIYDQEEIQTHDVLFYLELMKTMKVSKILEPFCGTGRILIPLAEAGYSIVGMDKSTSMLERLKTKLNNSKKFINLNNQITIHQLDVVKEEWPIDFDVVILGGNCMYELATPEEQQELIGLAHHSLRPGGYIFVDNDNIEGLLSDDWCHIGVEEAAFPTGICSHGVKIKGYTTPIWVEREKRLWRADRRIEIEYPDGEKEEVKWSVQNHPVSFMEVKQGRPSTLTA